jgi:serine/threonine protein kinase
MGEVRAGWDKVLERPVAVKLLREDAASNPAVRRRFEAEARAAAGLLHPNIVQVYDSGEDCGVLFIVMEKLPGRSLRDDIRTRRLSVVEATGVAVQVLAALEAAHRGGLMHRDIKPANILYSGGDHWKVADFGIAKSLQPTDADETVTGMVIGTPAYLPPERLLGGDATPGGDVYAVGVILYEALAGRRPFETTHRAGWVSAPVSPPAPVGHLRPDVPTALSTAIERSLSRDPSHRFATAGEMADAIRSGGTPADERPGWLAVPPAMPGAEDRPGHDPDGEGPPGEDPEADDTDVLPRPGSNRPSRPWLAGIAGCIAALLAAAAVLAASNGAAKARTPAPPTTVTGQVTTTLPATSVPAVAKTRPGRDQSGNNRGGGGDKGGEGG